MVELTGDGKVTNKLVRVGGIENVVDQIDTGIFTANYGRQLLRLEAIKRSRER